MIPNKNKIINVDTDNQDFTFYTYLDKQGVFAVTFFKPLIYKISFYSAESCSWSLL